MQVLQGQLVSLLALVNFNWFKNILFEFTKFLRYGSVYIYIYIYIY